MQIKQIETFYWAARLGSFAKAAGHLNATTSSVSMRIQELEHRLGVVLFHRAHRGIQLTSDALYLLPLAEQMLAIAAQIYQPSATKAAPAGYVRIGVAEVIALGWLPVFAEELKQQYPGIQIEIEVALSHRLEDKLMAGTLDVLFAPCIMTPSQFSHLSLGGERFCWMCSPDLDEVPDRVTPAKLMSLPLIVTSREHQFRGSILDWINDNNVVFRRPIICNTFAIAANMALAGMGCAFLPIRIYGDHVERSQLRIIHSIPDIAPLEHFVIREAIKTNPVYRAVERVALAVSQGQRFCSDARVLLAPVSSDSP